MEEMDYITVYSRKQAIEDGVLIDVTDVAMRAGILCQTAVTLGVWALHLSVPGDIYCEDEQHRLWDILCTFRSQAEDRDKSEMIFRPRIWTREPPGGLEFITLKAVIGPGDDERPVITIMLPDED